LKESLGGMKRKSSVTCSSEKKFRNKLSINCIENLSNELLYEIFDYLDAWDIYNAFSNLNYRFQELLDDSSISYKIKLADPLVSNEVSIKNWRQIMRLNRKQILSIHLVMSLDINCLLLPCFINSSFHRLQSLVLIDPKPNTLMFVLEELINLPRLYSLTIDRLDYFEDLTDIYRIILALPMLTYCKISVTDSDLCSSLAMSTDQRSSPLQYLIMDHDINFNELSTILSYTPHLRHLCFIESYKIDVTIEIISSFITTNLTYLRLRSEDVTFDQFETFIRQTCPKLKVLVFITFSEEMAYLDAHRWEQLIVQDLPQLEKFSLQYYELLEDTTESNVYFKESNPFLSSFWLDRQWMFEIELERDFIIYFVRPYKYNLKNFYTK
jgi:hypothetical protein